MLKCVFATCKKVPVTKPPWGTDSSFSKDRFLQQNNSTCTNTPIVGKLSLVGVGRQLLDDGSVTP